MIAEAFSKVNAGREPRVLVCDLDNCISDDGWRMDMIKWSAKDPDERYGLYHCNCWRDSMKNADLLLAAMIENKATEIIIITSRPESVRQETLTWCERNVRPIANSCGATLGIYMRPEGNHEPSAMLKAKLALSVMASCKGSIVMALDDRQDVLDAYVKLGIETRQLKINDTDGEKHPPASSPQKPAAPPELLRSAAALFEERNLQYGDGYKRYGALLVALFPESGVPAAKTPEEAVRLNMIMMCLAKLQRYAHNFTKGGHKDSARDLQVYGAMLEEHTK